MEYALASHIELENAVDMLKAMAHPIRLSIADMLNTRESMCVTEIYERLGIEQAVVSQHLKILKDKGIVDSRKKGKHCYYFLRIKSLDNLLNCIESCQKYRLSKKEEVSV